MNISDYCYNQGMNIEQYEQYEYNIKSAADAIKTIMLLSHKSDTGMYYNLLDVMLIVPELTILDQRNFIIRQLKQIGVEFFDNNTLYRI